MKRFRVIALGTVFAACVLGVIGVRAAGYRTESARRSTVEQGSTTEDQAAGQARPSGDPAALVGEREEEKPPLQLEGQVIDEDELPIPGAVVALLDGAMQVAHTAEDGIFHFRRLEAKTYRVVAHADDRFAGPISVRVSADVGPLTLRMRRANAVTLTILDGRTRAPIEGARVDVPDADISATSDADGRASLRGLCPGHHSIRVERATYAPLARSIYAPRNGRSPAPIEVLLQQGAAIAGLVVDAGGRPVAGARLQLEGPATVRALSPTISDAAGRFAFAAVPAGRIHVVGEHEQFGYGRSDLLEADGKASLDRVEVRLAQGFVLQGRVVTRAGEPAVGATVRVASDHVDFGAAQEWPCDNRGAFRLAGLPAGPLRVVALRETATSAEVIVEPPSTGQPLVLTLDDDASIEGEVVTGRGEPASDVQVAATLEGPKGAADPAQAAARRVASAATGADGRFVLAGLSSGDYRLRASCTEGLDSPSLWLRRAVVAHSGDKEVRIVLDDDAVVRGRVAFEDGATPDSFTVALTASPPESFAGGGGAFELSDVPPGKQAITINGPGIESKFVDDVTVEPGKVTDLGTIRLKRARTLGGHVVNGEGRPVAGAEVTVAAVLLGGDSQAPSDGASTLLRATSGDDGHFVVSGVPRVPLAAQANHPTAGRSLPVPVRRDLESPTVELVVRPPGSLEGQVLSDGQPVIGASVVATRPDTNRTRFVATTGADGRYRLDDLAAGDYQVTVIVTVANGRNTQYAKPATVPPGASQVLDFDLPPGKVDVTVSLFAKSTGKVIPNAQAFLVVGSVNANNAGQLETAIASAGAGARYMTYSVGGVPALFQAVLPNKYSLCVVAIFADLSNPLAVQHVQRQAARLPAACVPFEVTNAQGTEQQSKVYL